MVVWILFGAAFVFACGYYVGLIKGRMERREW